MRAIIIQDSDAANLLDLLKLEQLRTDGYLRRPNQEVTIDGMHRVFHMVVCRWLQEQGATVIR